jgi:hypothetical protein
VETPEERDKRRRVLYKKLAFLLACPEQYNSDAYINFDPERVDPYFYCPDYD